MRPRPSDCGNRSGRKKGRVRGSNPNSDVKAVIRMGRRRSRPPWMMAAFRLLASMKFLRGTAFDPFGRSAERKRERALIAEYEAVIAEICDGLNRNNHDLAVAIASIPEHIRGYGHVKDEHLAKAKAEEAALLRAFRDPNAPRAQAAE